MSRRKVALITGIAAACADYLARENGDTAQRRQEITSKT